MYKILAIICTICTIIAILEGKYDVAIFTSLATLINIFNYKNRR